MNWLSAAPCDGDCDNCPHDDCIDEEGIWDGTTEEERRILRTKPRSPDYKKVYYRLYKRRRYSKDNSFRKRSVDWVKNYRKLKKEDITQ